MPGGYHLAVQKIEDDLAFNAMTSIFEQRYAGEFVTAATLNGMDSRKHNFVPRAIVWKVLADDGMPIKSIARVFGRSRTGIQSGITRLNQRLPYDEQASQLFEATRDSYHAKTHTTR